MFRNPAHLLALDRPPATRLLRACGVEESILRDGSDYDRFAALAAAMPLCAGNALAAALEKSLQDATGLTIPLTMQSAPDFWRIWTEIFWYKREITIPTSAHIAPSPAAPVRLSPAEVTRLPDPRSLPCDERIPDLSAFAQCLEDVLPSSGGYALMTLPPAYEFRRPDPYHANLALRAVAEGKAFDTDREILLAQALRELGERACRRNVILALAGGKPETILAILAYLAESDRLPRMVWLPDNPADAAHACGLYPQVETGYRILPGESDADVCRKRATYAAVAPIGRALELTL